MGNTHTENTDNNQADLRDNEKQARQGKKAFEQGTGNNSTTSGYSKVDKEKNNQDQQSSGSNGDSKKDAEEQDKINDDEDVDDKAVTHNGV